METKMELEHGRQGIAASEFKEQVRVNLNRYLQRNPGVTIRSVASRSGYSMDSIKHFRNRSRTTLPLALRLIESIPELSEHLKCPTCGALPTFIQ